MNERLVFVLALAAPAIASAQDQTLNEDRAVATALEQNPHLRAVVLEEQRAAALVEGEDARYGFVWTTDATFSIGDTPSLTVGDVTTSYSEQVTIGTGLMRTFDWGMVAELRVEAGRQLRRAIYIPTMPTPIEVGPGYSFDATLSVTQPLLRGFGTEVGRAGLRQAEVERDRAHAAEVRAASELARDARLAYWELWYSDASARVEEASRDLAIAQLEEARAREELGALGHPDTLVFATRRAAAEEAVELARSERRARALELGRLLGGVDDVTPDETPPELPPAPAARLVERAMRASPEIAELEARIRAAEESERTAGESLEARLDLRGELGVHGMGYDDVGATFEQFGTFEAVTGLLSLHFEWPLDDTQRASERTRARLAIAAAERELEATRQAIRARVQTVIERSSAARRRLELSEETVALARESAEAERARFELGATTAIAVTQAENELRSAQLRALRARVDLVQSDTELAHSTGELVRTLRLH
jgi:outer membrane protein